jgi:hypothetical protein
MKEKNIDITIKPDGTIDFDLIGYEGKGCEGDIDEIINAIGKKVTTIKKREYYKTEKVKINQKHT